MGVADGLAWAASAGEAAGLAAEAPGAAGGLTFTARRSVGGGADGSAAASFGRGRGSGGLDGVLDMRGCTDGSGAPMRPGAGGEL
jgi:hypothetical protein